MKAATMRNVKKKMISGLDEGSQYNFDFCQGFLSVNFEMLKRT